MFLISLLSRFERYYPTNRVTEAKDWPSLLEDFVKGSTVDVFKACLLIDPGGNFSGLTEDGQHIFVANFDTETARNGFSTGSYRALPDKDHCKHRSDDRMRWTPHSLGLSEKALKAIRKFITQRKGLCLVTGPTGSGKSTTLQAIIMEMDRSALNILTIEDPVERELPGVTHCKVTKEAGWNDHIKAFLRMKPHVILIGEIRDQESARLALKAANTGHLVLSTLHTNDVASTINRLVELGVKRYELADCLRFVSAQELTGKLCDHCKIAVDKVFERNPNGCERCMGGISGRKLLMEYTDVIKPEHINSHESQFLREVLSQSFYDQKKNAINEGHICRSTK